MNPLYIVCIAVVVAIIVAVAFVAVSSLLKRNRRAN
jgi:NADH:ubiquinone oxidoreductase subunit 3 (subunit A)